MLTIEENCNDFFIFHKKNDQKMLLLSIMYYNLFLYLYIIIIIANFKIIYFNPSNYIFNKTLKIPLTFNIFLFLSKTYHSDLLL